MLKTLLVFQEVAKDRVFFDKSGGGMTLGGGEPLASSDFTIALLRLFNNNGIHTALDTSGYASWEVMKQVLKYVDLILYDIKHMDPAKHQEFTGVSNEPSPANSHENHCI